MKFNLAKFIVITILLITISSVNPWSKIVIGDTVIWWVIFGAILIAFYKAKAKFYDKFNERNILFINLYLIWNIVCICRGAFIADNYWEWKNLIGFGMVLLLPFSIYISTNQFIVQKIVEVWLKYALPAFFLFALNFQYPDAIGRYLVPITFVFLFFPVLSTKWKIITLAFALFVFLGDLTARSNVIKFGIPLILSLIYYFQKVFSDKVLEFSRLILLSLPFVLFTLAILGIFNVYKMDEYLGSDYKATTIVDGVQQEQSLTADTRTFLFVEVLNSAIKYNYVLFGHTPARGNESESFGLYNLETLKTGKMERFSNEVSILNVFTWTGLVGVVLYFLIFYRASYLAVNKSNNIFIKIMGVCVAFRWVYAWVEDFSSFDLTYFFLWMMIGMCFSKSFREMNNKEIVNWVKGITDPRYRQSRDPNKQIVSAKVSTEPRDMVRSL